MVAQQIILQRHASKHFTNAGYEDQQEQTMDCDSSVARGPPLNRKVGHPPSRTYQADECRQPLHCSRYLTVGPHCLNLMLLM